MSNNGVPLNIRLLEHGAIVAFISGVKSASILRLIVKTPASESRHIRIVVCINRKPIESPFYSARTAYPSPEAITLAIKLCKEDIRRTQNSSAHRKPRW